MKISGQELLGKEFANTTSGLIGFVDIAEMSFEYFRETGLGKSIMGFKVGDSTKFVISKLKDGDFKTIVVIAATAIIGVMMLYSVFSSENDASTNEEEKEKEEMKKTEPLRDFTIEQLVSNCQADVMGSP